MTPDVALRTVEPTDLPIFFEQQLDPTANYMVAFTSSSREPTDRDAFMAHWARILANETGTIRTIVADGEIAGSILCFEDDGHMDVGYWLGRSFWSRGIATEALRQFIVLVQMLPLYARAAKDNAGSLRVLEKCGFTIIGESSGYAPARGGEVEEYLLILRADGSEAAE